jgi:hypothetical protein
MDARRVFDVIAEVNKELAESMSRISAAGEQPHQADQAHDEFLELVIYGNKVPAVANFLHEFYNSGSGVIKVCIDPLMTSGAVGKVFRYDLAESLKKALLTYRAGYFVNRNGEWLNGHGESFVMTHVKWTAYAPYILVDMAALSASCRWACVAKLYLFTV